MVKSMMRTFAIECPCGKRGMAAQFDGEDFVRLPKEFRVEDRGHGQATVCDACNWTVPLEYRILCSKADGSLEHRDGLYRFGEAHDCALSIVEQFDRVVVEGMRDGRWQVIETVKGSPVG